MIHETIKYVDYNGVEREETHWFNLNKAELAEMELSVKGGFSAMVQQLIATEDTPTIVKIFKDLIHRSYGVKSLDGKRFMKKNPEGGLFVDEFEETEAYSELFMKLSTDSEAGARFVNGVIPADLAKQLAEQNK